MAFNPFSSFRKYQKYWMAGAVLVCMLTFVLCSGGMRGTGLDEILLPFFSNRGRDFLRVNGRWYSSEEISDLKDQRNIANDFMRELANAGIKGLKERIKEVTEAEKKDERNNQIRSIFEACLTDLSAKLYREPRYFRGGNKLDDLIEFILWRDLAKDYGVNLTDEVVKDLVDSSCHARMWGFNAEVSRDLQFKIHQQHFKANDEMIKNAITQEFRVQIVQLALIGRWSPGGSDERNRIANLQVQNSMMHIYLNTPMQMRIAPTPEQISTDYRKNRATLDISMLPVSLETLAKSIKLDDNPQKKLAVLEDFYNKYSKKPYNPTLDTPGFVMPEQAEIQFFAADAGMEYYRQPAKTLSILEKTPLLAFDPLSPLASTLSWLATSSAWEASLERNLNNVDRERTGYKNLLAQHQRVLKTYYDNYLEQTDEKKKTEARMLYEGKYALFKADLQPPKNGVSALTTPYYYSAGQFNVALGKPNAATAAALIGAFNNGPLAGLAAYQEGAYQAQAKKIAPMLAIDKNKRALVGAEMFLTQTPQLLGDMSAFTAACVTAYADSEPQFLPLAGYIEEELRNKIEEAQAQHWVNGVMLDAKRQLEAVKGNERAFKPAIAKLKQKYSREVVGKDGTKTKVSGLKFGETTELRNEYDVEFDEALKPLRDSFDKYRVAVNTIEGRSGKPEMLREGDFNKLFFGNEPLGLGSLELFTPRVWPPYATVPKSQEDPLGQRTEEQHLFDDALLPVIFWKSVKLDQVPYEWKPDNPKKVEFVEKQYRLYEARGLLMAKVKELAEKVKAAQQIEGKDMVSVMRELAKESGTELVPLSNVSLLVENPDHGKNQPAFVDYSLPRGRVPFARPDMVQQLLALRGLSAPLKIGNTEVDELNTSLFDSKIAGSSRGKIGQIQVLTNKPRSVYYIATVTGYTEPTSYSYFDAVATSLGSDGLQNRYVDQVQTQFGKEILQLLIEQLKTKADLHISEAATKQFADEPSKAK